MTPSNRRKLTAVTLVVVIAGFFIRYEIARSRTDSENRTLNEDICGQSVCRTTTTAYVAPPPTARPAPFVTFPLSAADSVSGWTLVAGSLRAAAAGSSPFAVVTFHNDTTQQTTGEPYIELYESGVYVGTLSPASPPTIDADQSQTSSLSFQVVQPFPAGDKPIETFSDLPSNTTYHLILTTE